MVSTEYLALPSLFLVLFAVCDFISGRTHLLDAKYLHRIGYTSSASYTMVTFGGFGALNELLFIWYQGGSYPMALLASYMSNLLLWLIMVPVMGLRFKNMRSVGDILGVFYGRTVELTFSSLLLLFCLMVMSVFMAISGWICSIVVGLTFHNSLMIIAVLIAIRFCMANSQEADVCNDLKLGLVICILVSIASICLNKIGGIQEIAAAIELNNNLGYATSRYFTNTEVIVSISCLGFLASLVHPPTLQWLLSAQSRQQIVYANITNLALKGVVTVTMWLIGAAYTLGALDKSNDSWLQLIILLPTPFSTLAIFAILVLLLSQVQIYAKSAAVLYKRNIINHKITDDDLARYHVSNNTYIAIYSTSLAMAYGGIKVIGASIGLQLILFMFISIPIIVALLNYKISTQIFWLNGILSIALVVILNISGLHLLKAISSALCASVCFIVGTTILQNGRFIMISSRAYRNTEVWLCFTKDILNDAWRRFCDAGRNFIKRSALDVWSHAQNGTNIYTRFGALCCVISLFPCYTLNYEDEQHFHFCIALRIVAFTFSIILILSKLWYESVGKYTFLMYWYFIVWFVLPFATFFSISFNNLYAEQLLSIAVCFLLTGCILNPFAFFIINILGVSAGILGQYLFFGTAALPFSIPTITMISVSSILAMFCGIGVSLMFSTLKQKPPYWLVTQNNKLVRQAEHVISGALFANILAEHRQEVHKLANTNACSILQEASNSLRQVRAENSKTESCSLRNCLSTVINWCSNTNNEPVMINQYFIGDIRFEGNANEVQYALYVLLDQLCNAIPDLSNIEIWNEYKKLSIKAYREGAAFDHCELWWSNNADNMPSTIKLATILCTLVMEDIGGSFSYSAVKGGIKVVLHFP
ncbi:MAG: hypothetical protein JSS50_03120 [Proteobacteria bacterium]|nr:hypothetical protein [Pseudomonadota bacterium]